MSSFHGYNAPQKDWDREISRVLGMLEVIRMGFLFSGDAILSRILIRMKLLGWCFLSHLGLGLN